MNPNHGGLVRMSFLLGNGVPFSIFLFRHWFFPGHLRVLAKDCSAMSWRSLAINFSFNWYLPGFDIYFWTFRPVKLQLNWPFEWKAGWWQTQIFFLIFTPKLGEVPTHFDEQIFSDGLNRSHQPLTTKALHVWIPAKRLGSAVGEWGWLMVQKSG